MKNLLPVLSIEKSIMAGNPFDKKQPLVEFNVGILVVKVTGAYESTVRADIYCNGIKISNGKKISAIPIEARYVERNLGPKKMALSLNDGRVKLEIFYLQ